MSGNDVGREASTGRLELLARWGRILGGYYNDYSAKTDWHGATDDQGIPLNQTATGRSFHFPMTVVQKALGHWERWLASDRSDERHRSEFLRLATWILHSQDVRGGWPTWAECGVRSSSPYSAMTQGQATSMLVRAFRITDREEFAQSARRAAALMVMPVEEGGTAHMAPAGVVLEEVPRVPARTVLNGWINGIYGLYDLLLMDHADPLGEKLDSTLAALVSYLPRFDAKYWSYYDTARNLASPYYHARHIAQLSACELTFPEYGPRWRDMRQELERQASSGLRRLRAVATKACQQLCDPPDSVMK
jgi:hypothetical protein